jgi:hypothetical protein
MERPMRSLLLNCIAATAITAATCLASTHAQAQCGCGGYYSYYPAYYGYAYNPYAYSYYRPYAYSYYRPYAYGAYAYGGYGPRVWAGWGRRRWW